MIVTSPSIIWKGLMRVTRSESSVALVLSESMELWFKRKEFKELSDEDNFSKNNEFSTWLKEERGIYFSDLLYEVAHDLFSSFVKAWNK